MAEPLNEEWEQPSGKGAGRLKKSLVRLVPALGWARHYSGETALADAVAGVTLGLTLVPQSIAYASLADLPVHYGLYSAFLGTILYCFLGTVREVSIGPTSLMALLTLQAMRGLPLDFLPLLTFLSGCVVMAMGLLRLGFLVEFISPAVTSGFTSGTALIIVFSQLKAVLGLSFTAETIIENVTLIAENISKVRAPDAILALICCTVLLALRKVKDVPVSEDRPALKKALWLLSISRNAFVVCASSVFAFCTYDPDKPLLKLSGRVEPGLPPFGPPSFSITMDNSTLGFVACVRELGSSVVVTPVVMVLANIAIAKAFSSGRSVDARQEMLCLGLVNAAGSFFSAMPTCGAFTRSAVSASSGVRTPAAGLYSGAITLVALMFLTQYFFFIPRACLASVLICAVIFMIDVSIFPVLWRRSRSSLLVLLVTLGVSVLWSVEAGVPAGVLADVAVLLHRLARPRLHVTHTQLPGVGRCIVVRPALGLCIMSAEFVWRRVARLGGSSAVLLDLGRVSFMDYTAVKALQNAVNKYKKNNQHLVLFNACPEVLCKLEREEWLNRGSLRAKTEREALVAVGVASAEKEPAEDRPLISYSGDEKPPEGCAEDTV